MAEDEPVFYDRGVDSDYGGDGVEGELGKLYAGLEGEFVFRLGGLEDLGEASDAQIGEFFVVDAYVFREAPSNPGAAECFDDVKMGGMKMGDLLVGEDDCDRSVPGGAVAGEALGDHLVADFDAPTGNDFEYFVF